ncbi:MAG: cellulose-binding protein, partial [Microgenomates group bacterium]
INQWAKDQKDDKYHPPTEVSDYKFEEGPTITPTPTPLSIFPSPTITVTLTPTLPPSPTSP